MESLVDLVLTPAQESSLSASSRVVSLCTMSTSFAAGVLAYMIATFNGGYLWHLVLFNEMYASLKTWTRFDDVVVPLGASAVFLQVRGVGRRDLCKVVARMGGSHSGVGRSNGSVTLICMA